MISGPGSGKAVEDTGLRVAEGGTGKGRDAGGETGGDEGDRGAAYREGSENDKRGKDENSEKEGRNMGNDDGGGFETFVDYMPLVHIGQSSRLAVALALILGIVGTICAVSWGVVAAGVLFYPASAVLFYVLFRRSRVRSGPPADMAPVCLALLGVSLALLLSDNTVLSGLLLIAFAIFFCGMSTGQWLVVVAETRKTGFWGAVSAARKLEGRARERAWADLVEGRS